MTIKNKKTKQSSATEVSTSKSASSSVKKTSSTSTSVQKTSNTLQKVSSGKKVCYIDVKVEEDDPLMITDITDHASTSGSIISEHYNSHPHYIITEAPSTSDLSQIRSHEHNVSDMAQVNTGEFVSSSELQQSSTSHQQSSRSEVHQSSSTSVQRSDTSHSQTFDSSVDNQTLNTAFIDSSAHNITGTSNNFLSKSQSASATDSFLQTERTNLINTQAKRHGHSNRDHVSNKITSSSFDPRNMNIRENDPSRRAQNVRSDSSNFYGGQGTLDKNVNKTEYSSTSHSSETKSSNVTKSSSSSYVVEIVDGKERIIDSSKREWGDAQEHATKEDYASVSGTNIKPESAYSVQNYDMKSKYDTGKPGLKPSSEMTVKENSKFVKDGNQITSHDSFISHKDNAIQQQHSSTTHEQLTSQNNISSDSSDRRHITFHGNTLSDISENRENISRENIQSDTMDSRHISLHENTQTGIINNRQNTSTEQIQSNTLDKQQITSDSRQSNVNVMESQRTESSRINNEIVSHNQRRDVNKTDSSNFYGYDSTIQNELKKVGNILQVRDTENLNYSTKILKSNTSSAHQESTSSYVFEVVDGKQRIVDSSHREWGDSKDHSTNEKSHYLSGTNIKPEHEYTRHVLDKESFYDTGKNGVPKSGTYVTEESSLYKNGKEIASTSNTYGGDFTKKPAITEHTDRDDVYNKQVTITDDQNLQSNVTKSTNIQSNIKDSQNIIKSTDFITKEKQNLTKETTSSTSQSKDTLTTYERSTGTWNGKFVYENDDDRPKRPKQMSPFGKPEQPRHHLKRQDTEENIILSSRDIKDFTSISDLRKIIETSQSNKDVKVSNNNIVIKRNIDDKVLKEIIETVKKYPFKRIDKVTFGTKINEDVKDLYEGIDTEETIIVNTTTGGALKKSFDIEKTRSQIEVTRYITENGVTRKITTYEDAKEDDKIKTDVFVDNSSLDIRNLKDVRTTKDIREYDVVDRAITDTTREDTVISTVYDENIIDERKTVRDDKTTIEETVRRDETRPRHGGPKKPEKIVDKEQCICEICTCGRHRCPHNDAPEPMFDVEHTTSVVSAYKQDYNEKHVNRTSAVYHEDHLRLEGDFVEPERPQWQPAERPKAKKPEDNLKPEGDFERRRPEEWRPGERASVKKPEDNLRPEGEFAQRKPDDWRPGDRAPTRRPEDNLKPEGEFNTPEKETWRPADRQKPKKPQDNLRPEGEFDRPKPEEWRPGERAPVRRPEDNLKPEGDFEDRRPEEWKPGDRAPVRRPQDNLKPEGEFEKRRPDEWRPGDRAPTRRPEDNLKPEGDFTTNEKETWRPADRQKPIKPEDNLRPEGEFEKREPEQWRPGDRAPVRRPEDNLKPEGDFAIRRPEEWQPGDRAPVRRPQDNLKPEGEFTTPEKVSWRPAERQKPIKPEDNLKPEGEFTTPAKEDWKPAERPQQKKPVDNLKPEGDFTTYGTITEDFKVVTGERAEIIRRTDNIITEGEFTDTTTSRSEYTVKPVERPKPVRRNTWTKIEGEMTTETTSQSEYIDYTDIVERTTKVTKMIDNLTHEGVIDFVTSNQNDYDEKITTLERPQRRRTWTKEDFDKFYSTEDVETLTTTQEEYRTFERDIPKRIEPKKPKDNLRPEGEFEKPHQEEWRPAERPKQKKPEDNLKSEGVFEQHKPEEWQPAERRTPSKPKDNLRTEGDFETPEKERWRPAERPQPKKPQDNLRPEGDFEQRKPDEWQPADRVVQKKPKDNLKPEGEFETPEKERWRPAERPQQKKPQDNLRPEGDFEQRKPDEWQPAERPVQKKPKDNLKPEGEFETPEKERWRPAERPQQKKPQDNLRPEGDFEQRKPDEWQPADRPVQKKPKDNLKPEGEFETPQKESWRPAERPQQKKPHDNLRPEGDFEQRKPDEWKPADRPVQKKPKDNLKPEGEFETPEKERWRPAERPQQKKPHDNLRPEGDFEQRKPDEWQPAQRPEQKKPKDNLKPEGQFESPEKERWRPAERPIQKKPEDNLKPEGEFEKPKQQEWRPAERPTAIKPDDNLKPEGKFDSPKREQWRPAERPEVKKPKDNLKPEGEFLKPKHDEWQPAEKQSPKKPKDNLKPEGDMEVHRRTDYVVTRGDRADIVKHEDHLKMEGVIDIHRSRDDYKRIEKTEKVVIQRHEDNLRTEGEFIDLQIRDDYKATKGERAPVIKPQDNLKTDGKFYKPEIVPSQPAEKRKPFKHVDNITIERDTDVRLKQKVERVDIIRREDNLKVEGEFIDMKQRNDYSVIKGDRTAIVKHEDNLKMEGTMENTRSSDTYRVVKGQRVKLTRREDNLKIEGVFEDHTRRNDYNQTTRNVKSAITYDSNDQKTHSDRTVNSVYETQSHKGSVQRLTDKNTLNAKDTTYLINENIDSDSTTKVVKYYEDENIQRIQSTDVRKTQNIGPEFVKPSDSKKPQQDSSDQADIIPGQKRVKPKDGPYSPKPLESGDIPIQMHPKDNIKPEGEFDRPKRPQWQTGERATPIRPKDTLHTEYDRDSKRPGDVLDHPQRQPWQPGEKASPIRPKDNLHIEDEKDSSSRPGGDFERPRRPQWQPGERASPIRPKDNLQIEKDSPRRPEGGSDRPNMSQWQPGERASPIRPKDNILVQDGKESSRTPEAKYSKGSPGAGPKNDISYEKSRQVTPEEMRQRLNITKYDSEITTTADQAHSIDNRNIKSQTTKIQSDTHHESNVRKIHSETHTKHTNIHSSNVEYSKQLNQQSGIHTQQSRTIREKDSGSDNQTIIDSSKQYDRTPSLTTINRDTSGRLQSRHSTERNVVKQDTKNVSSVKKTMKQITEKKLIGGKWVHVTRNVEVSDISHGENKYPKDSRIVGSSTQNKQTSNKVDNVVSTANISNNSSKQQNIVHNKNQKSATNNTYIVEDRHDVNHNINRSTQETVSESQFINQTVQDKQRYTTSSEQHFNSTSNQAQQIERNNHISSDVRSHEHTSKSLQHGKETTRSNMIVRDNDTKMYSDTIDSRNQLNQNSAHQINYGTHSNDRHIQHTSGSTRNVSSISHIENNTSKTSSLHQSHTVNRNHLSDSVTKTSMEFQRAMHGGGDVSISSNENSTRIGHHKRTSNLISDVASTNAVLHRKGVTSTTEAQHSTSSTAAAQRKSITNLSDRGEYISNSNQSTDRKSISSMHRSARDNVAITSQHTESTDVRRQQRRDGESTMVIDRQPRVVVRDNLRVGGDFYGHSEARSYGNFSRSNHTERSERSERVERQTRHGNTSHFTLGDGSTSYKKEFTTHVHGTCPATLIESPRTPFKHTRDSREHKFYTAKITQQKPQ